MRGQIIFKILESIGNLTIDTFNLLEAFISAGYGVSAGQLEYKFLEIKRKDAAKSIEREMRNRIKQKYYNTIYKLKMDGLIQEKIKNDKKFFVLTNKGKGKLIFLKEKQSNKLPTAIYQKEKSNKLIIIIFDIPEKEKNKRVWLRGALKNLEFKMIQKSVWVGKFKIPKNFVDDLLKLKIINFVEIFEITKSGSLKQLF